MRNSDQLIHDMSDMSPIEWNNELAKEYGLTFDEFLKLVSNYEYVTVSEDNIHHKMKKLTEIDSEKVNAENSKSETEEVLVINSSFRNIGNIEFDPGDILDQMIFCGFTFNESTVSSVMFKNSILNNCISTDSDFSNARFIQCKLIDCDLSRSDLSGVVFTKTAFYDCNFKNARLSNSSFYDCIFYNCQFYDSDCDYLQINSSLIHNCIFDNSSMRAISSIASSISNTSFTNTNLRDSSLFDTNLITVDFKKSLLDNVFLSGTVSSDVDIDVIYADIFGINLKSNDDDEDSLDYEEEDDDD